MWGPFSTRAPGLLLSLHLEQRELELRQLVSCLDIRLFHGQQTLYQLCFGHRQIASPHPIDIPIRLNPDRLWLSGDMATASGVARSLLVCLIGAAVFLIIRIRLRIPKDSSFLHSPAFWIKLPAQVANCFKRYRFTPCHQLIDGRLDQLYRPLALGLVVLLKPGRRFAWPAEFG